MRLLLTSPVDLRDGTSNKDARLTNCLKESKTGSDKAVVRPGLVLDAVASGIGKGLVRFNDELISVYGTTLGYVDSDNANVWSPSPLTGISGIYSTTFDFDYFWGKYLFSNYALTEIRYSVDGVSFSQLFTTPFNFVKSLTPLPSINKVLVLGGSAAADDFAVFDESGTLSNRVTFANAEYRFGNACDYTTDIAVLVGQRNGSIGASCVYNYVTGAYTRYSFAGVMGLSAVFYGNNVLLAIGFSPQSIWKSSDGASWSNVTPSLPAGYYAMSLIFDGTNFVVGAAHSTLLPKIFTTVNGTTWSDLSATFQGISGDMFFYDMGYDSSYYYLFCSNNLGYKSADLVSWSVDDSLSWWEDETYTTVAVKSANDVVFVDYTILELAIKSFRNVVPIMSISTVSGDYFDFAQGPQ